MSGGILVDGVLRRIVSAWVRSCVAGRICCGVVVVMCMWSGEIVESVNEAPLSHMVSVGGRMGWVRW